MNILLQVPIYDILIVISLLIGFLAGINKGFIKKVFRLVTVALFTGLLYYFLAPVLVEWIKNSSFATFNFVLSIEVEGFTFKFYSINDLCIFLQNLNIDPKLIMCWLDNFLMAFSFIIILALVLLLTLPITWITNAVINKIKKKKDTETGTFLKYHPSIPSKLLGGLIGVVEWVIITYFVAESLGVLSSGLTNVILKEIIDTNSAIYSIIASAIDPNLAYNILSILNNTINPTTSIILGNIITESSGIWMFKGYDTLSVQETFSEFYKALFNALNDSGLISSLAN